MSFKPIEPGCLAIIKTGEHAGREVTVIERATYPVHRMPNGVLTGAFPDSWIIELGFEMVAKYDSGFSKPVTMGSAQEKYLLRIDGGEDESLATKQEQEVSA